MNQIHIVASSSQNSWLDRLKGRALLLRRHGQPFGRRRADREPKRGWGPVLVIIVSIALLDWAVKAIVAMRVPLGDFLEVWDGRVAIWHVRNEEMMLGLWGNLPLESRQVIAVVAAILAFLILFEIVGRGHRLPPRRRPAAWLFVGTAFGGMLGNLGERALHWGVTDYLSFAWGDLWLPPGNIADLALFASMPLAVLVIIFEFQARTQRRSGNSQTEHSSRVAPVETSLRSS
ncbi:MAG: signal peptidase II [Gemmatimonadetes bacterium]|nr:signal peptidase II [Gemmatimonadota bacterium]